MVTPDDIRLAYDRIRPHVRRTPLLKPGAGAFGVELAVTLKLELLQHTGSFKPRGAFNNLLSRPVPAAGVTAASGGNHGAAVAYAAKVLGHKARIFVPEISSPPKIARIREAGAELVVQGSRYDDALALCEAYAAATGALGVHAFNSEETIAGQGTVGLEWEADAPDLDTVLVAVGGGGLIAGIATWYANRIKSSRWSRRPAGRCRPPSPPAPRPTWRCRASRPTPSARATSGSGSTGSPAATSPRP